MEPINPGEYVEGFYRSALRLRNKMNKPEITVEQIKIETDRFLNWIKGNDSLQRMKMYWAFWTYCMESIGGDSFVHNGKPDVTVFVDWLKANCGMNTYTQKEVIADDGSKILYRVYHPQSIAFGNCSEKRRTAFFERTVQFLEKSKDTKKYGISFQKWQKHYVASGA